MKKLLFALTWTLLGFGCATPSLTASDFTPPTTRATNAPPASAGERRLMRATSTDGVHFTSKGEVLTEQANVPDIVMKDDGTLYMYYVAQGIEQGKETVPVAISKDNGATWTYHFLSFKNWPSNRPPSDPDVVIREDGTFRMYFTDNVNPATLGIAYGDSTDGINFTYEGIALTPPSSLVDSSTFYFNGVWHMMTLEEKTGVQHHATSRDGDEFTLASPSAVTLPMRGYFTGNPLVEKDTVRMFAFSLESTDIRSFTTSDVTTWRTSDIALDATDIATDKSGYIQDMAVQQLVDGTYLMVYVTEYADE